MAGRAVESTQGHVARFDAVADLLRSSAQAHAHALARHRGSAAEAELEMRLDQALNQLAVLYGRGSYEMLSTAEIIDAAIDNELHLAHELPDSQAAAVAARTRAQLLVDVSRRGANLRIRGLHEPQVKRGVYLSSVRSEVLAGLQASREPYLRWRDGIVVVLDEARIAELRAAGDNVAVLFLDPDELLDLAERDESSALDRELARRLATAQASPARLGDSSHRHLRRRLLRQSTVLRNLRDRLSAEHPVAHASLAAVLDSHRALLRATLAAAPPPRHVVADPLVASTGYTEAVQELLARVADDVDPAGFGSRFRAAVATTSGTRT